MAPEQTGRMNRSIDSRSDLYSFGATLYQMLTGTLPFTSICRAHGVGALPYRQKAAGRRRAVRAHPDAGFSRIVMKLLAKTAEARYQTALGGMKDPRRCLAEWERQGRIEPLPLGEQDAPDRLLVPEKLYGRAREVDTLLTAFDRVVTEGAPELVLVSGYSGMGESSVVHELHRVLVLPGALFAAGKFDQYKRGIPYATLAQAFQSLVRRSLSKSDAELGRWRDALTEALGPNGQLMIGLIPELATSSASRSRGLRSATRPSPRPFPDGVRAAVSRCPCAAGASPRPLSRRPAMARHGNPRAGRRSARPSRRRENLPVELEPIAPMRSAWITP